MNKPYHLRTLGQLDDTLEGLEDGNPVRKDVLAQVRSVVKCAIDEVVRETPEATIAAEEAEAYAENVIKNIVELTEKNQKMFDECMGPQTMRSPNQ